MHLSTASLTTSDALGLEPGLKEMLKVEIEEMSSSELWTLHLELNALLLEKLTAKKEEIEWRLSELHTKNPDRRLRRRAPH